MSDPLDISHERLSIAARNFLEGPLGAYMVERSKQDIEAARDALEQVTPWAATGRLKWRAAKLKLAAARQFRSYLNEMLLAHEEEYGD